MRAEQNNAADAGPAGHSQKRESPVGPALLIVGVRCLPLPTNEVCGCAAHTVRCDPRTEGHFENDLVLFMQNESVQGALKHSGVIIPVQHRKTVFDLSEAEIIATFRLLSVVKKWMDYRDGPDGYNIGWNCYRTGGQEVFHAHMHVIPRFPTRAAGWQRHQNASEVRREQMVSRSKYEGTPNQGMEPTRNKPRAAHAQRWPQEGKRGAGTMQTWEQAFQSRTT